MEKAAEAVATYARAFLQKPYTEKQLLNTLAQSPANARARSKGMMDVRCLEGPCHAGAARHR